MLAHTSGCLSKAYGSAPPVFEGRTDMLGTAGVEACFLCLATSMTTALYCPAIHGTALLHDMSTELTWVGTHFEHCSLAVAGSIASAQAQINVWTFIYAFTCCTLP
jgi:hypothetical protein